MWVKGKKNGNIAEEMITNINVETIPLFICFYALAKCLCDFIQCDLQKVYNSESTTKEEITTFYTHIQYWLSNNNLLASFIFVFYNLLPSSLVGLPFPVNCWKLWVDSWIIYNIHAHTHTQREMHIYVFILPFWGMIWKLYISLS